MKSISIEKNKSVCSSYSLINCFTLSVKPNSFNNCGYKPLEILLTSSSALLVKAVISTCSKFCDFLFINVNCCPTLSCNSLAILVRSFSCDCNKPCVNCSCNFFFFFSVFRDLYTITKRNKDDKLTIPNKMNWFFILLSEANKAMSFS